MAAFCPGLAFLAVFCPVDFCPYTAARTGLQQRDVQLDYGLVVSTVSAKIP